jgi:dienelactone hydrolase
MSSFSPIFADLPQAERVTNPSSQWEVPGLLAEEFQTPQAELLVHAAHRVARRSSAGKDIDALVSARNAALQKPRSWHHNPRGDFFEWREEMLSRLTATLVIPDSLGADSAPEVKERIVHEDYIEEHVEITLTPPLRSTAIVTIPKNGRTRHPALVLLHSFGTLNLYGKEKFLHRDGEPAYLTAYRRECYGGRSLLADFARQGYLCLAIDSFGFGERTKLAGDDPAAFRQHRLRLDQAGAEALSMEIFKTEYEQAARALGAVGLTIAALTATDDLRSIDYLAGRPDVDPARIGCAGLSLGAFRVNYLASLDDRVKAAVSVCWLSTLNGVVDYNLPSSLGFFALPGDLYRDYDMVDICLAAAPKPFLAISGWRDILMEPFGMVAAHVSLRQAWETAGHPSNVGSLVFDAPHEFNVSMQERASDFLRLVL